MPPKPIFVLSIMPRCGTNFLHQLLVAHPHCKSVTGPDMPEDFLLFHADLLDTYARDVAHEWLLYRKPDGDERMRTDAYRRSHESNRRRMLHALGSGMSDLLHADADGARPVTHTPSVRNLELFTTLFPEAQALIVVRDGRSVVESGVKSFGWSYEGGMQRWGRAATRLLDFLRSRPDDARSCLVVRYEHLVTDGRAEMQRVFEFLELDAAVYDFAAIDEMPVLGSSEGGTGKGAGWEWEAKKKSEGFDPLARGKQWEPARVRRFDWVAGPQMAELGYHRETAAGPVSFVDGVRYRIADWVWGALFGSIPALAGLETLVHRLRVYKRRFRVAA